MLELKDIKGVGDATIKKLRELDIKSVFELFSFLPSKYIDLQAPISVCDGRASSLSLFEGRVEIVSTVSNRGKRGFYVLFSDCIAQSKIRFKAIFYNMPFLHDGFEEGQTYRLLGKLSNDKHEFSIVNPQLERTDKISKLKGIYTVYPLKGVMGQNAFKNIVYAALDKLKQQEYEGKFATVNRDFARYFELCHRPNTLICAESAREYLAALDVAIVLEIYKKQCNNSEKLRKVFYKTPDNVIHRYSDALNFEPTASQFDAFDDIINDLTSKRCMSRIISGDVGSGKTAVAFFAMCYAALCGHQAALMAPTEILAAQHMANFAPIASSLGVNCAYLSGSVKANERKRILEDLKSGKVDCVIGTHALVSENVEYSDLSLAIIDEQHRFGVNDRAKLEKKGAIDVLSMTATPIPRSMALTFYQDIAISYIKKREDAKTNVKTKVFFDIFEALSDFICLCQTTKTQAFIVCPSINDAEGNELQSIEGFVRDYSRYLNSLKFAVLHGKMSDEQKRNTIDSFRNGEIQLLVATSVIEVGVDTLAREILILNADRFGLASLHQLRGRVGRDGAQAHCYLHCGSASEKAERRLDALCNSNDGQYLAEIDFEMRGAGDFIGTKQSGVSQTPIFGLPLNAKILFNAKQYASEKLKSLQLSELLALTRQSKNKVEAFLDDISKVTINS